MKISGTNTKKREAFKKMIADGLDGKFDLILVKSISRFGRNTVDTLTACRALKSKGVDVFFEKENINIMDSKGELFLTIMSSLAQEESRSISENVRWGISRAYEKGSFSLPFKQFLGYKKGADGRPEIVEEEAEIVRDIYLWFLQGETEGFIAKKLTSNGVPTPAGKEKWTASTVHSILTNEKYCGNALLRKCYVADYLEKTIKKNNGELPQYFVEHSHKGIVSTDVFDLVQYEMDKRKASGMKMSCSSVFSTKVFCKECGKPYGGKVYHSNDKYRYVGFRCNNKYNGEKCSTPTLRERDLEALFLKAFNVYYNEQEAYEDIALICQIVTDTAELEGERESIIERLKQCASELEAMIKALASNGSSSRFKNEYGKLELEYNSMKARLETIETEIAEKQGKRRLIEAFERKMGSFDEPIQTFCKEDFTALVDKITIGKTEATFEFKNGVEISVDL